MPKGVYDRKNSGDLGGYIRKLIAEQTKAITDQLETIHRKLDRRQEILESVYESRRHTDSMCDQLDRMEAVIRNMHNDTGMRAVFSVLQRCAELTNDKK
jgi:hypothetical protein